MTEVSTEAQAAAVAGARVEVRLPTSALFIGGEFVPSASGRTFETIEPASGAHLASVPEADETDIAASVTAASRAAPAWSASELPDRARILDRIADLVEERCDALAALECADTGRPLSDAREGDVPEAAAWFRYFADIGQRARSEVVPGIAGYLNYVTRAPYGVVGLIVPWNYPLLSAATKIAPAIAVGNCAVLKPAEHTPLSALALAAICQEAGLPDGVLNIVLGGSATGRALVEDGGVAKVSFTGSTAAGRDVLRRAADRVVPVTVELGGKSPTVVFADADLDAATDGALFSFCTNAGQLCTAGARLLVDKRVHDEFVDILVVKARALRVGDPWDELTQIGSLIGGAHYDRVHGYVSRAIAAGSRLVTGGSRVEVDGLEGGYFYPPTVFDQVEPSAEIAQAEVFGPVATVTTFENDEEAIELANGVEYGLSSAVWTRDLARAHRAAAAIDAGIVYVNTANVGTVGSPSAAWKQSGHGIEGGIEQALDFTRPKSVFINVDGQAPRFGLPA